MLKLIPGLNDHDEDGHEDYGGLHRDLKATGASMDRRSALRIAGKLGAAFGALQLLLPHWILSPRATRWRRHCAQPGKRRLSSATCAEVNSRVG